MPMHGAEYTPPEKVPFRNTANKFNGLEITAKDSLQQPRKKGVTKVILSWADRKDVEHTLRLRFEMRWSLFLCGRRWRLRLGVALLRGEGSRCF